eukprot:6452401-Lingulodinium_polyedra.AAC.1
MQSKQPHALNAIKTAPRFRCNPKKQFDQETKTTEYNGIDMGSNTGVPDEHAEGGELPASQEESSTCVKFNA